MKAFIQFPESPYLTRRRPRCNLRRTDRSKEMFAEHGNPRALTRFTAIVTLLAWLSALVLCSAECFNSSSQCARATCLDTEVSHHDHDGISHSKQDTTSEDAESDHHEPARPQRCNSSFCDSLNSTAYTTSQASTIQHTLSLAYLLPSFSFEAALLPAQSSSHFRQAPERKWVFTPEVCLGPAFRSLAPPLSHLV